jgi:hypothetical protein
VLGALRSTAPPSVLPDISPTRGLLQNWVDVILCF